MSASDKQMQINQETDKKMREKIMSLPEPERLRVAALYQLFQKKLKLDEQMDKEIEVIEEKYYNLEKPLLERQMEIIAGHAVPTEEEMKLLPQLLKEDEQDQAESLKKVQAKAIPEYWLKVLKNCEVLDQLIEEKDEPVLKHLTKVTFSQDGLNLTYHFYFSPNDYFKNDVLKKEIIMESEEQPSHSVGTEIQWCDGKDLTKKMTKKKQKNKKTGQTRVVERVEKDKSFFNFFGSQDCRESHLDNLEDEEAEEIENQMNEDLDVADILKDEAIPFSLEYYLGVNEKEEDDQGDDEDDEDDEDEDSEEEKPAKK